MRYVEDVLPNGYELINGVAMHAALGDRFQIVNPWFKRYVDVGDFVELRVDSPRFAVHPDAAAQCTCELCNEEASKPILCHDHPATLIEIPRQPVPSRGWGEQFWVQVSQRDKQTLLGRVDNPLYESRLHGIEQDAELTFQEDHILSIHGIHNEPLIQRMSEGDLAEFAEWVTSHHGEREE